MSTPFTTIAERLGGRLVRRWPLEGGVSADVQGLEVERSGTRRTVVFRRYASDDWKGLAAGAAAEFSLLTALHEASFPVPEPLLLGEDGGAPWLVMSFVEGETAVEPSRLPKALSSMVELLVRLHTLDPVSMDLPELPRRDAPHPELLTWLPARFDELRPVLERWSRPPERSALLHGDYWSGNIIWREGQIVALIDWEDAALGDPTSDLAGARVELMWAHGADAVEAFTSLYRGRCGWSVEPRRLAAWDMYVGSAALASMGRWGFAEEVEAAMRAKTWRFLERAAAVLAG